MRILFLFYQKGTYICNVNNNTRYDTCVDTGGYQSGQMGLVVNKMLPVGSFGGSNPSPPTTD